MKYKIELRSAWERPQYFETNSEIELNNICFEGHNQQYLVYVNGVKKAPTIYKINNKKWNKETGFYEI